MKVRLAVPCMFLGLALAGEVRAAEKSSIGLGLGLVDVSDVGSTLWLTGNVHIPLAERVGIEPEIGFWSKSESAFGVDASIKDINVGANVVYRVPKEKVTFHVGGGLGLHHLTGKIGVLDLFEESDSETKIGFQLLGGIQYQASEAVALFARVRVDLVSDVNQTKVYAGLRFGM